MGTSTASTTIAAKSRQEYSSHPIPDPKGNDMDHDKNANLGPPIDSRPLAASIDAYPHRTVRHLHGIGGHRMGLGPWGRCRSSRIWIHGYP